MFTFIYNHIYLYTLLYIHGRAAVFLWWTIEAGGGVPGASLLLVWRSVVWVEVWSIRARGGVPGAFLLLVGRSVVWWRCGASGGRGDPAGIYPPARPGRAHARLLSAAGSLASESKFRGGVYGCDCSNYQLFKCPLWGGLCKVQCRLNH